MRAQYMKSCGELSRTKSMDRVMKVLALVAALRVPAVRGFARSLSSRAFLGSYGSRAFATASTVLMSSKMDQSFPTWTFDKPCTAIEWSESSAVSLSISSDKASYEDSDLVLVCVFGPTKDDDDAETEDAPLALSGWAKEIDEALGGPLTEAAEENAKSFKAGGSPGASTPTIRIPTPGGKSKRYALVGLGKPPKDGQPLDSNVARKLGASIAGKCNSEKKVTSCSVVMPEAAVASTASTLSELSSAFYAALYSDNRYRTGDKIKKIAEDLTSVSLLSEESSLAEGVEEALATGKKLADGVFLSKDIVGSPHNVMNSLSLAETAKRIAAESNGRIKCTILGKKECEKRGMGSYLGVARGSETEPQFIHLTYSPPNPTTDDKKIAIVGKGLLFDTGGYNIKTAMMELMKFDCGGAAAVLGAARAVAAIEPDGVEAHFIVAACENMINDRAVVPSDVLTASNGKTIEIINTDAEGRLTLADALVYADKEVGCEKCIELSTLTGSCMVALGKQMSGVWTSDDDLAKELESISKDTGDKSWRMPLESAYNDQLESLIADIKNCGTRWGGSITAALFLENFMDKKKPFAHIDIAGPVWNDKTGATGYGVKLVTEWVRRQGMSKEE